MEQERVDAPEVSQPPGYHPPDRIGDAWHGNTTIYVKVRQDIRQHIPNKYTSNYTAKYRKIQQNIRHTRPKYERCGVLHLGNWGTLGNFLNGSIYDTLDCQGNQIQCIKVSYVDIRYVYPNIHTIIKVMAGE